MAELVPLTMLGYVEERDHVPWLVTIAQDDTGRLRDRSERRLSESQAAWLARAAVLPDVEDEGHHPEDVCPECEHSLDDDAHQEPGGACWCGCVCGFDGWGLADDLGDVS